jgi:hypothetical protein
MALPLAFVSNRDAGLAPGGPLQLELDKRLAASSEKAAFAHMGIALVDLTRIGENAESSGAMAVSCAANPLFENQVAVGSLSKISILFAAYALRERVILACAAVGTSATNVDDLVQKVQAGSTPEVPQKIKKSPHDFPDLKRIFEFAPSSPWTPKFHGWTRSWEQLKPLHETPAATIKPLPFLDRLRLAIRFSDNNASGSCARDISFQYQNGSLGSAGFDNNQHNGFLWEGGDFGFAPHDQIMGAPPWDPHHGATWVRANARGIASYLTLLWANSLVSGSASREMRDILEDRAGIGFATYMGNATKRTTRTWSKIGILTGSVSEGLIVETSTPAGTVIRYVAVGLSAVRTETLQALAKIFYETISSQH